MKRNKNNKVILFPDKHGAKGWPHVFIGDKEISLHGGIEDKNLWYNLGWGKRKDNMFIQTLIKEEIPFTFSPNGRFPRLSLDHNYFENEVKAD